MQDVLSVKKVKVLVKRKDYFIIQRLIVFFVLTAQDHGQHIRGLQMYAT
jgi:hypothetical protein